MIMYLRRDEIDLAYDEDDPLGVVAELEKALRRHGLKLPSLGLDQDYLDATDGRSVLVELGACRGDVVRRITDILNGAPVERQVPPEPVTVG
ncbi:MULTISPECIES: hypothetical protein [Streptomyces]|uniref:hypothetical protein n=1 Tax=Streptomyces TaxID=1883 RepID=UPI00186B14A9|nr:MULTISPECIES: hypothetical protein [Streptomyces]